MTTWPCNVIEIELLTHKQLWLLLQCLISRMAVRWFDVSKVWLKKFHVGAFHLYMGRVKKCLHVFNLATKSACMLLFHKTWFLHISFRKDLALIRDNPRTQFCLANGSYKLAIGVRLSWTISNLEKTNVSRRISVYFCQRFRLFRRIPLGTG